MTDSDIQKQIDLFRTLNARTYDWFETTDYVIRNLVRMVEEAREDARHPKALVPWIQNVTKLECLVNELKKVLEGVINVAGSVDQGKRSENSEEWRIPWTPKVVSMIVRCVEAVNKIDEVMNVKQTDERKDDKDGDA